MVSTRYATLEHWRGLAALWVVFFHSGFLWKFPTQAPLTWLHTLGNQGWFGVHLFFVISGYCLAELASRHVTSKRTTASFLIDRAHRVFPTYWAALGLAVSLAVIATPFNGLPLVTTSGSYGALPANPWAFITNITLTAPLFDSSPYLLVSWTLTCELAFYALVAIGLLLIRLHGRPFISVLAGYALAFAQAAGLVELPGSVLDLWPEFMCGVLTWQTLRWKTVDPMASIAGVTGIIILAVLGYTVNSAAHTTLPASAVFALILIVLKKYDAPLSDLRAIRILGWCGGFSYSLYLTHGPFLSPLQNLIHRLYPDAGHQAWLPLLLVGFSILPAWLFYQWIEKPVECWRRARKPASIAANAPLAIAK